MPRFSKLVLVVCLLSLYVFRGKAEGEVPAAEIEGDPPFIIIYSGEELASALRSAYSQGNSSGALSAITTAVTYMITEKRGGEVSSLVAAAVRILQTSGSPSDVNIAGDVGSSFGEGIEQVFTDPGIIVASSDVAAAVAPALVSGAVLSSATMAALDNVVRTTNHCVEVGSVLSLAKSKALNTGNDEAFTTALKTYKEAAVKDSTNSKLLDCASDAFTGLR